MNARPLVVASVGHVGNSVLVRGGMEVLHDRLGAALRRQGTRVIATTGASESEDPGIVQFFGAFYALEGAFEACQHLLRVLFPVLLRSDRALAPWRSPLDRFRSRLPWSLHSARRRMLAEADLVVVSSQQEAAAAHGYGARRIEILKGGVDLDSSAQAEDRSPATPWSEAARSWLEAPGRAVAIGRFEARKRQLELARLSGETGLAVLFVGRRSPTEPTYLDRVRAALPPTCGLWEDPPDAVVRWALARSDVHLLASRHETIGLVSLEAAAAGCRPVAIDQPTSREYLLPFGELAADASPASLRSALRRALERGRLSPEERRLLEPLSWDSMAARLVDLYGGLLASAGS